MTRVVGYSHLLHHTFFFNILEGLINRDGSGDFYILVADHGVRGTCHDHDGIFLTTLAPDQHQHHFGLGPVNNQGSLEKTLKLNHVLKTRCIKRKATLGLKPA